MFSLLFVQSLLSLSNVVASLNYHCFLSSSSGFCSISMVFVSYQGFLLRIGSVRGYHRYFNVDDSVVHHRFPCRIIDFYIHNFNCVLLYSSFPSPVRHMGWMVPYTDTRSEHGTDTLWGLGERDTLDIYTNSISLTFVAIRLLRHRCTPPTAREAAVILSSDSESTMTRLLSPETSEFCKLQT